MRDISASESACITATFNPLFFACTGLSHNHHKTDVFPANLCLILTQSKPAPKLPLFPGVETLKHQIKFNLTVLPDKR